MLGLLLLHIRFRFKMPGKLKNDGKHKKITKIPTYDLRIFLFILIVILVVALTESYYNMPMRKKSNQPTIGYKNNQQQKQTDAHDESIVHHQHMLKG